MSTAAEWIDSFSLFCLTDYPEAQLILLHKHRQCSICNEIIDYILSRAAMSSSVSVMLNIPRFSF